MTLVEKFLRLQEMGKITIDIGCEILSPIYTKDITSNEEDIDKCIERISQFTRGGAKVFCDNNKNPLDKLDWINQVLEILSERFNQEISKTSTLVKEKFLKIEQL